MKPQTEFEWLIKVNEVNDYRNDGEGLKASCKAAGIIEKDYRQWDTYFKECFAEYDGEDEWNIDGEYYEPYFKKAVRQQEIIQSQGQSKIMSRSQRWRDTSFYNPSYKDVFYRFADENQLWWNIRVDYPKLFDYYLSTVPTNVKRAGVITDECITKMKKAFAHFGMNLSFSRSAAPEEWTYSEVGPDMEEVDFSKFESEAEIVDYLNKQNEDYMERLRIKRNQNIIEPHYKLSSWELAPVSEEVSWSDINF